MPFIAGKSDEEMKADLAYISEKTRQKFIHLKKAHHVWIDSIQEEKLRNSLERIRTSRVIMDSIHKKFPDSAVFSVKEADELYWAVSPQEAGGSDCSLVDCHYDAPFAWIPTGGVTYYRVILACNENNEVTTVFPTEHAKVKMTTGDYHGLDYNQDWHCVEGSIPPGKYRILLKLHYIVVPEGSEGWSTWVKWINVVWTKASRETMRMSAEPANPFEWLVAAIVNVSRTMFNNGYLFLVFLMVCTAAICAYRNKKR